MLVNNELKIQDTFCRNTNYIVHISSSVLIKSVFSHLFTCHETCNFFAVWIDLGVSRSFTCTLALWGEHIRHKCTWISWPVSAHQT